SGLGRGSRRVPLRAGQGSCTDQWRRCAHASSVSEPRSVSRWISTTRRQRTNGDGRRRCNYAPVMAGRTFEIVCEVEPPTRPDLMHVRHQIGVLSKVASAFLIPDNHIGRATVSSVAVAHEVERMGGRSIACLNARDRNLLGFRRDLLTAAAYGVDQFLFVYGDRPSLGSRTGQLTVQSMMRELRAFPAAQGGENGGRPFRA